MEFWVSQVAQWVKNLPAMQKMQEAQLWSLGQEDPLEEEMATWSSILAWKIPWTEETCGLQSMGSQRVRHNWAHTHTHICPTSTLWSFHLLKSHGWLAPASVVSYLGKCRHCNEFLRSCRMDPHQWLKLFSYFLYYHSVRKRRKQTNQRHFQVCFRLRSWSTWLTSS